ncbi:MAG: TetR/AcrR family transcriptional regulator [Anaerolineae bacterium]|nr:TetR/AcrR family transcriptional regulator [Anaerolineae bacterium]
MSDELLDRRVQRTRALLRSALIQLVDEKGYDAVTIQDITERANLGRTTFYLHYESKDDLMLDHHADFASQLTLRAMSTDELMGDNPPDDLEALLQELADHKQIYFALMRARHIDMVKRGIQRQMADNLLGNLRRAYPDREPLLAIDMLTNYIAGAYFSMIDWWLTNRTERSAKDVATLLHRLQRAAIRDAYGDES